MLASAFLPRGSGRLFALLIALLPCWLSVAAAQDQRDDNLLTELKVAYIYNLTRFIEWPAVPAERPFVIGVIGDPVMARHLRALEQEAKRVEDRPIEIRAYPSPEAIGPSEILFVGTEAQEQLAAILRRTAGQPTLLVGDTPGDAERGLAIEIYRKPDIFRKTERLRLRINAAALKDRGLAASARLYDVAEVVR
ncbi:YfiR family protein [Thiocapsa roseopersicina]|uniref:YfiR family protein n=1 Tax=Thiocapsa roseopersicina TaxID=1058 RepID=A0A1H2UBR8_THIRO|nr:YfiR family protein [Thiocapsa roseopersicina]SDW52894.1 protein of unknown function [Thiocapsa roseopersicina]